MLTKVGTLVFTAVMTATLSIQPVPEQTGLLAPSGMDAETLEAGLLYDLVPLAEEFIEAEEETGVNAMWLAAIAALESGWGRSDLAKTKHNLFGWSGLNGYATFLSPEICVESVARKLRSSYLNEDGKSYHGTNIEGIAVSYSENPEWADAVREIYDGILRRCGECT